MISADSGAAGDPVRIAMWSGPRNISTAMMRAFGNRSDAAVVDEPLYAHYLDVTGREHPGRDEVLAAHERDWRVVVTQLGGPVPAGKRVWYQKHMAHHLTPDVGRDWLDGLRHAFLIREPMSMLASLSRVLPDIRLADTGLMQQLEIFDLVLSRTGLPPPVVDARDVLRDPPRLLKALCGALGIPWDAAMLSWPPGPRETDGAWAKYWYASVDASTGFLPYRETEPDLPRRYRGLLDECDAIYARLHRRRLGR